jgi:hypothetical protein
MIAVGLSCIFSLVFCENNGWLILLSIMNAIAFIILADHYEETVENLGRFLVKMGKEVYDEDAETEFSK